jgi:hypothetical protein
MRSGLAGAVFAVALSSGAFAPGAAHAQHQPLIKPGVCAQGYVPVCAVKQRTLVTYVNGCAARGVNARIIAADRGCFEGCPERYAPVCATDTAGKPRLYGNACEAEKSRATNIRNGRCRLIRRTNSPGAAVGAVP